MVNTSKMGDLDINLITLYARTPALYDKRNPLYKDKVYAERAWNDIATRLGYKVEILKDRMLQLRNRYNLEKRKIETMKNDTSPNPKSSWVLFRYLSFFDGHIKQRRSYKMLRKIQDANDNLAKNRNEKPQRRRSLNAIPTSSSNNNSNDSTDFHNDLQAMSNLMRNHDEIKSEDDSDVSLVEAIPILNENSSDSQIFDFNNSNNNINGNGKNGGDSNFHRMSSSPLNNDNNSCGPPPMTVIAQHPYAATTTSSSFDNFANLDKKFNKYNAFGQFIAASLADLTDDKATDVMQRITMEIFAAQRDLN